MGLARHVLGIALCAGCGRVGFGTGDADATDDDAVRRDGSDVVGPAGVCGGPDVLVYTGATLAWPSLVAAGGRIGLSFSEGSDVRALVLDMAGAPVAPAQLLGTGTQGPSRIVSIDQSELGIVWSQLYGPKLQIAWQRLDTSGALVSITQRITNSSGENRRPYPVWTGSEVGLLYEDDGGSYAYMVFKRFDRAGTSITFGLVISEPMRAAVEGVLSWTGGEYVASWFETALGGTAGDVAFGRIAPNGTMMIAPRALVTSDTTHGDLCTGSCETPSAWLAPTATGYAVKWHSFVGGKRAELAQLDLTGATIARNPLDAALYDGAMSRPDANLAVAYPSGDELRIRRVGDDGATLGDSFIRSGPVLQGPDLAPPVALPCLTTAWIENGTRLYVRVR